MEERGLFRRREPFAFMLYLGMGGSCILFLAIFAIFLRKEYVNQNIPIQLPPQIWLSTVLIVLGSLFLYTTKIAARSNKHYQVKYWMLATLGICLSFIISQYWVWNELFFQNKRLSNDTSAAFIYLLTGLHLFHVMGGFVALFISTVKAFRMGSYVESFIFSVNPPNQLNLKLISIYWHFLDLLWWLILLFLWYHAA
ncbi:MAG: cytochrome c oxidase subunit 3 [Leadbetterella sp.]